jgi:hypothetical protein
MQDIFELKEQAITETPLLVFECVLADGRVERWSTHRVTVAGVGYEARVLSHNVFEIQAASDQGVDGIPRISIVLANADSHFSALERAVGWKGARLKVAFLFYDLRAGAAACETSVVFQGICNPPDEIREATFRITAGSRLNLQRLVMPQVRIQRRCPWSFPATDAQRAEAVDGGALGKYSRFYRCGYSAGVAGGFGFLDGESPFAHCGYTRADCQARGMFDRFGGIEFVPPAISVRTFGEKNWHTSAVAVNQTRYNDFVPMVYGTAWYQPPVVFARNDGNLTRMEVLLGVGEMQGVLKVLVNDVEIPLGVAGTNMTGTGWHNVMTLGTRSGVRNPDFTTGSGQPAGDPYGSMAYLAVVVPNRLNDGSSLPRVKVLAQGLKLPMYGQDGAPAGEAFSSNPAWILLDVLRRMGWDTPEIDLGSFARAASVCEEAIGSVDLNGNTITLSRFQCNLALQTRRSAGDLVRGIRNASRLLLSYGPGGLLQLAVEDSMARELAVKPDWSNAVQPLNGGWPSYEFGDGTNGTSGILRRANGEPSVRVFSRSVAEAPNRFMVEFQDALNEYQQDSFSVVDAEDVERSGQEVAATLNAIGIANYDQAARVLKLRIDKSVRGNTYIEFDTSVKAFGVRAGDLIAITYLKEGFNRQAFRVLKIAPGVNHRVTTITAQIHDDSWYADSNGQLNSAPGGRRQSIAGIGVPRPLLGSAVDANGDVQFGVEEWATTASDGTEVTNVRAAFVAPAVAAGAGPGIPLLSLVAQVGPGGSLAAGQVLYYSVAGVDDSGQEGALSFLVRAAIPASGSLVTLTGLSFAPGTAAFHVYRGPTPAQMYRIASDVAPSGTFTDTGLAVELAAPVDPNFDHANFYWRLELMPETQVTAHSANTIANGTLGMPENRYRGASARITRGRGKGQERTVAGHTATTLTVAPPWEIEPDATSWFTVAEGGWKFAALSKTSPVEFEIPNRAGETVEIMGRAANVNDLECAAELSTVTRWQIGGSGGVWPDSGVPPAPAFGLARGPRGGTVELSGVSFGDLENTRTISAATLTLHYRDEIAGELVALATPVDEWAAVLDLIAVGTAAIGEFVQVDEEVMRVEDRLDGGQRYAVTRAMHGTIAARHESLEAVHRLLTRTTIAPFPAGFFGSPYSGSWTFPVTLADARVASAELFCTNRKGDGPSQAAPLTHNDDHGLRTLSGGQYSLQVSGFLAVDVAAAPPLVVEASHAVKDVYAALGTTADAEVRIAVRVDGSDYCTVQLPAGATVSEPADGGALPPLMAGSKVTIAVEAVGQALPGADLTVIIRL